MYIRRAWRGKKRLRGRSKGKEKRRPFDIRRVLSLAMLDPHCGERVDQKKKSQPASETIAHQGEKKNTPSAITPGATVPLWCLSKAGQQSATASNSELS